MEFSEATKAEIRLIIGSNEIGGGPVCIRMWLIGVSIA
jgi:hypothetical protein